MPNDDNTPQIWKRETAYSSVTHSQLPRPTLALQRIVHVVFRNVVRQPDVGVDGFGARQLQVPARNPSRKLRDFGLRNIRRTAARQIGELGPGAGRSAPSA